MRALVESVKDKGVNQPALVRPHPDGNGYEIVAGHRRQKASEFAGFADMPCIVREFAVPRRAKGNAGNCGGERQCRSPARPDGWGKK